MYRYVGMYSTVFQSVRKINDSSTSDTSIVSVYRLLFLNITCIHQVVLDSKNSAIRDLQYELARVCKVHINT